MRWEKQYSNLIVVKILSAAYTLVTLLAIFIPLHFNIFAINQISYESMVALLFWLTAMFMTWVMYYVLRHRPQLLLLLLILTGMSFLVAEVLMWEWLVR